MLCSHCGVREVEVLIKQVINNDVTDISLCRKCAEELGYLSEESPSITISFSIGDSEKVNKLNIKKHSSLTDSSIEFDSLTCGVCGTDYKSFKSTNTLGCPGCYEAFRFPLGAYLQKTQGAESHWEGSVMFDDLHVLNVVATNIKSDNEKVQEEIVRLMREINEAVVAEDYERAAQVRDAIKSLTTGSECRNDN